MGLDLHFVSEQRGSPVFPLGRRQRIRLPESIRDGLSVCSLDQPLHFYVSTPFRPPDLRGEFRALRCTCAHTVSCGARYSDARKH